MKHIYLYLIIIVTCILSSCNLGGRGKGVLPIELVQAENIMYENPDSALQILQGMTIPTEKEAHATWALLLSQAKYKCNVVQSDSLVNIAHNYFMKGDNAQRKSLASYLKGGLLDEKNQVDKALIFYLEAAKECEYINDNLLNYLINAHIARIYSHRDLHDYAILYRKNAIKYAEALNEYRYIGDSFLGMARAYSAKKEYQKAIEYYDRAIGLKDISSARIKSEYALQEKIDVLIRLKDYNEALNLAKKLDNSFLTLPACATLGHLYYKLNQIDSAYFYLNKATKSNNIYTKQGAYQALFNITKNKKNYKKNADISVKLWKINDSINKIDSNKALIEMQEKYNQQKIINEKNKAERIGLVILCISVCVIGIVIVCYQGKVLRQNKELEKKRKELNNLQEQLNENNKIIDINKERMEMVGEVGPEDITEELQEKETAIKNMQQQNEKLKKENEMLQDKIKEHVAVLRGKSKDSKRLNELINRNTYLRKREIFLSNQLLKKDEMITSLKQEPNCLKDYQWQELKEKTDGLFDGYTERLFKIVPSLTTHDIHICCLIKLSFSHTAIADILGISPTSLSRQKQRMKERIIQQVGSLGENVLLDIWLKEF